MEWSLIFLVCFVVIGAVYTYMDWEGYFMTPQMDTVLLISPVLFWGVE